MSKFKRLNIPMDIRVYDLDNPIVKLGFREVTGLAKLISGLRAYQITDKLGKDNTFEDIFSSMSQSVEQLGFHLVPMKPVVEPSGTQTTITVFASPEKVVVSDPARMLSLITRLQPTSKYLGRFLVLNMEYEGDGNGYGTWNDPFQVTGYLHGDEHSSIMKGMVFPARMAPEPVAKVLYAARKKHKNTHIIVVNNNMVKGKPLKLGWHSFWVYRQAKAGESKVLTDMNMSNQNLTRLVNLMSKPALFHIADQVKAMSGMKFDLTNIGKDNLLHTSLGKLMSAGMYVTPSLLKTRYVEMARFQVSFPGVKLKAVSHHKVKQGTWSAPVWLKDSLEVGQRVSLVKNPCLGVEAYSLIVTDFKGKGLSIIDLEANANDSDGDDLYLAMVKDTDGTIVSIFDHKKVVSRHQYVEEAIGNREDYSSYSSDHPTWFYLARWAESKRLVSMWDNYITSLFARSGGLITSDIAHAIAGAQKAVDLAKKDTGATLPPKSKGRFALYNLMNWHRANQKSIDLFEKRLNASRSEYGKYPGILGRMLDMVCRSIGMPIFRRFGNKTYHEQSYWFSRSKMDAKAGWRNTNCFSIQAKLLAKDFVRRYKFLAKLIAKGRHKSTAIRLLGVLGTSLQSKEYGHEAAEYIFANLVIGNPDKLVSKTSILPHMGVDLEELDTFRAFKKLRNRVGVESADYGYRLHQFTP